MIGLNQQQRRALTAISRKGGATVREMMIDFGIGDGRKRVSELINTHGIHVTKIVESGVNRYGDPVRYVRYFADQEDE